MNWHKKGGFWVLFILFLSNAVLFAAASHEASASVSESGEWTLTIEDSISVINSPGDEDEFFAQVEPDDDAVEAVSASQPSRAEMVMKAFAEAYPTRIGPAEFRDGDWAVQVYGKWFYYAEGRLLPEELRHNASQYASLGFYIYPADLPPWRDPTAEEAERYRGMSNSIRNAPSRSQQFYNTLYRAGTRDDAWDRVKQIKFLGHPVLVHYSILEPLSLVEEKILTEAKTKPAVKQWINEIGSAEAWFWREIADSPNRSYHSYGVAIDILPKSLRGLETYWLWVARKNQDWWKVPYTRRYHPPDAVVKAFESYGFVWGGKWDIYDTMHFEYRPEIIMLNGLPLEPYW